MKAIRIPTRDRMNFYAPAQLGRSRKITPEGYLLCEGVPIARLGTQVYSAEELHNPDPNATQLVPDSDGRIVVERRAEEVFSDESMASFEGKDVTIEHPNQNLTPDTWSNESVGHMQNIRRGTGIEDDLLVADLLIKAPDAIAYINRELPEVSCGYNSEYKQAGPGRAIQRNIIGNHLALVERGRAGPRCAFKDHLKTGETFMRTKDTLLSAGKILHAEECQPIPTGMLWLGDTPEDHIKIEGDAEYCAGIRIAIETLSEAQKKELRRVMKKYLGGAGGWNLQTGPQGGALVTDHLLESNRASHALARKMNDDAAAFWADRADRGVFDAERNRPRRHVIEQHRSLAAQMNADARKVWNQAS